MWSLVVILLCKDGKIVIEDCCEVEIVIYSVFEFFIDVVIVLILLFENLVDVGVLEVFRGLFFVLGMVGFISYDYGCYFE